MECCLEDQPELLPPLRREVEEKRRVTDHAVVRTPFPVRRDEGGEIHSRFAGLRARQADLGAEDLGDRTGRYDPGRNEHASVHRGRQRRRVELGTSWHRDDPETREGFRRRGRQRPRAGDFPLVLDREAVERVEAGRVSLRGRRKHSGDRGHHHVAVRRSERRDGSPRPNQRKAEGAERHLGLVGMRAVEDGGVRVEFGVCHPDCLQGGGEAVLICVGEDDVPAELPQTDQRRARGVLGASRNDRTIAEQCPASRDDTAVAVGVGVVIAERNFRSEADQPLEQGQKSLRRGMVNHDHSPAGETSAGRRNNGGDNLRCLLRFECLRQHDRAGFDFETDHLVSFQENNLPTTLDQKRADGLGP